MKEVPVRHVRLEDVLQKITGKQADDLVADLGAVAYQIGVVEFLELLGHHPVHPPVLLKIRIAVHGKNLLFTLEMTAGVVGEHPENGADDGFVRPGLPGFVDVIYEAEHYDMIGVELLHAHLVNGVPNDERHMAFPVRPCHPPPSAGAHVSDGSR